MISGSGKCFPTRGARRGGEGGGGDLGRGQRRGTHLAWVWGHGPLRRAFTLVEIAVVLAIVAIVGAIGWGTLRADLPRFRMIQAARTLRADLEALRALSTATNRETRLLLLSSPGDCAPGGETGGSWALQIGDRSSRSSRWEHLPPDVGADDGVDDASLGLVDIGPAGNRPAPGVCLRRGPTLAGPEPDNAGAIVFTPRGWVSNPGQDFTGRGYIELTLVNTLADAGLRDEVTVAISRSGNVRLETSLGDGGRMH
jgi:prepilin-type N-terminal cleavage/methylation domain-containing protein